MVSVMVKKGSPLVGSKRYLKARREIGYCHKLPNFSKCFWMTAEHLNNNTQSVLEALAMSPIQTNRASQSSLQGPVREEGGSRWRMGP